MDPIANVTFKRATIVSGASLSGAIDVQGYDVVALQQAASTEGTVYTFQGSLDGVTFADVVDTAGAEFSITKSATVAQCSILGAAGATPGQVPLSGFVAIKVRTGTSASPTVQVTTDAVVLVGLRAVA